MFREEVLSLPSMWLVSVHVGAELNPKVEKELYCEISEWGGYAILQGVISDTTYFE